jgi:hypothetical protein
MEQISVKIKILLDRNKGMLKPKRARLWVQLPRNPLRQYPRKPRAALRMLRESKMSLRRIS